MPVRRGVGCWMDVVRSRHSVALRTAGVPFNDAYGTGVRSEVEADVGIGGSGLKLSQFG